jgi:hypothetical protein
MRPLRPPTWSKWPAHHDRLDVREVVLKRREVGARPPVLSPASNIRRRVVVALADGDQRGRSRAPRSACPGRCGSRKSGASTLTPRRPPGLANVGRLTRLVAQQQVDLVVDQYADLDGIDGFEQDLVHGVSVAFGGWKLEVGSWRLGGCPAR